MPQNHDTTAKNATSNIITKLNDTFRIAACRAIFGAIDPEDIPGKLVVTKAVSQLPVGTLRAVFDAIESFNDFTEGNDPWGEHDFGSVEHEGQKYFWKIDYFDPTITYGSENPTDLNQTTRVLTVMLSHEY